MTVCKTAVSKGTVSKGAACKVTVCGCKDWALSPGLGSVTIRCSC